MINTYESLNGKSMLGGTWGGLVSDIAAHYAPCAMRHGDVRNLGKRFYSRKGFFGQRECKGR